MDPIIWEHIETAIKLRDVDRARVVFQRWINHTQAESEWGPYRILYAGARFFLTEGAHEDAYACACEANRLLASLPEPGSEVMKVILRQASLSKIPDEITRKELEIIEKRSRQAIEESLPEGVDSEQHLDAIRARFQPKEGGCFVATAAMGDTLSPEVVALCRFRDRVLEASTLGRTVISAYYSVSPPLAKHIARNRGLRWIARVAIVRPAARLARILSG